MRISATQLESFRLFMLPEQEWMTADDLRDTILGKFTPNRPIAIGLAFGKVLEQPDRYRVSGGYRCGEFEFGADTMAAPLGLIDRAGVFEAKALKAYGPHEVVSKSDHLIGAHLGEFKTTLGSFDFDKYARSCQWRLMVDATGATKVTYHVFGLDDHDNGVIEVRWIESFNLWPYAELHADCARLVDQFAEYVRAVGLAGHLERRQATALTGAL